MNDLIMNILRIRIAANKKFKGGRKHIKLSQPAQDALKKGHVSKFFWLRFDAKFEKVLTKKRVGHTSLARAAACTTAMAIAHIDSLAEELISKGIMTNYSQEEPGVWIDDIDGATRHHKPYVMVLMGQPETLHTVVKVKAAPKW